MKPLLLLSLAGCFAAAGAADAKLPRHGHGGGGHRASASSATAGLMAAPNLDTGFDTGFSAGTASGHGHGRATDPLSAGSMGLSGSTLLTDGGGARGGKTSDPLLGPKPHGRHSSY